jgi:hypothetical protein
MKSLTVLSSVLNKLFLIIPLLLFFLSFFVIFKNGSPPGMITNTAEYAVWKFWLHISIYFYELSAIAVLILWLKQEKKNLFSFLKSFRFWLAGILFSIFSFAAAGVIVDLGWLIYFIFISIIKR